MEPETLIHSMNSFNSNTSSMDEFSDVDFASRRAEEAVSRRYEAAGWLRKMAGVVLSKDLPNQPSEEEFRLGLRNGLILCNVINKVIPGSVPKVVENPAPSLAPADGAPLSAYQYFENVRNFLVAVQEMNLPIFEASDLEKGGSSVRVVDCVLALKAYWEWKSTGGSGSWKYGGNAKQSQTTNASKPSVKSGSGADPFTYSVQKNVQPSPDSKSLPMQPEFSPSEGLEKKEAMQLFSLAGMDMSSPAFTKLIQYIDSNKKLQEMPNFVESMIGKVVEEVERRLTTQEQLKKAIKDIVANGEEVSLPKSKILASFDGVQLNSKGSENNKEWEEILEQKKRKNLPKKLGSGDVCSNVESNLISLLTLQQREIQELKSLVNTSKQGLHVLQSEWNNNIYVLGRHMHGLAKAASGYHKVLEENRQLYNQVQELKGSIRVYCRVRPFLPGQSSFQSSVDFIGDDGNIVIINPAKKGKDARRTFSFNKVFGETASQEEVFMDTRPLIRSVLDGYNVCIFAYGQTGSGKTYTMSGPNIITEENWGVNYRALNDLFQISRQRKDTFIYDVGVQMIEIYNEQVRDLLASDGASKKLEIRNNSQHRGLNVPDANLIPVTSTSSVIELMNLGQKNRVVGATALNDRSSRSHSVLTVHVQGKDVTSGAILRGCLHLVDLAGSERVDKSEATGERLKEAQHINKSLSALGDVIAALAQKSSHVPYRNSKLTQVLQDALGGQAKTLMFVHISPEADAVGETVSTLKFAERVSMVELGAARANKESGEVKEMREEIAQLKMALARKEAEPGGSPPYLQQNTRDAPTHVHQRQSMNNIQNTVTGRRKPSVDQLYAAELLGDVNSPVFGNNLSEIQKQAIQSPPEVRLISIDQSSPDGIIRNGFEEQGMATWQESLLVNQFSPMHHSTLHDATRSWGMQELEKSDDHSSIYSETYQLGTEFDMEKCSLDQLHKLHKVMKYGKQDVKGKYFSNGQRTYEDATTDESEVELETRSKDDYLTSDSSEADLLWQCKLPNMSVAAPTQHVSLIRKPKQLSTKPPERRSIGQSTPATVKSDRRVSNGTSHIQNRESRQIPSGGSEAKKGISTSKFKHDVRTVRK